jgi:hypothetical protein
VVARVAIDQKSREGLRRTQRITGSDLDRGHIRIPAATKDLFPPNSGKLEIWLKGVRIEVAWNPRFGPDRDRSGVLSIPSKLLKTMVVENEVLHVSRSAPGVVYLGDRGSKLRIAQWVNKRQPDLNAQLLAESPTLRDFLEDRAPEWVSPLSSNDFRELSADMWTSLDLPRPTPFAESFWPARQPHWDAIARLPGRGEVSGVLLVEAKSHTNEVASHCTATSSDSIRRIEQAFDDAKRYLGVPSTVDWKQPHYQAANRLTFLYYLRARRNIPAWLYFIYFTGDAFEVEGVPQPCPANESGWAETIEGMHRALGLPQCHPLTHFAHEVFLSAEPSSV